jgi:outer membrane receptor for ferrienterochelin and colicins
VFINAENLFGYRQTTYDRLVRPSRGIGGRWTTDAWGPLEGRVANVGIRLGAR